MADQTVLNLEDAVKKVLTEMGVSQTDLLYKKELDKLQDIHDLENEKRPKKAHRFSFNGVDLAEPNREYISIIPIHDIHLGAINANKEKFKAYLKYICETEDTYTIALGDLIENATKCSVGLGIFETEYHIDEQIEETIELLRPLAEKKKILGIMPGNHEYRTMKLVSMDPMKIVADRLGIPYLGWSGYLIFEVGDQVYKVFCFHGASSSSTPAGRLNSIRKLRDVAHNMDLYLMGHVHSRQYDKDMVYDIDEKTGEIVAKKRHYVIGGSLLSYFGSYAEMKGLSPAEQGLVRIDLYKDKFHIHVHI